MVEKENRKRKIGEVIKCLVCEIYRSVSLRRCTYVLCNSYGVLELSRVSLTLFVLASFYPEVCARNRSA